MPVVRNIPVTDLLLDVTNARLPKEHASQQDALLAAAAELKGQLLNLAEGIRNWGLDPLRPVAVRPADERGRYVVVEGNRRLTAMKALESPAIIEPALTPTERRRLHKIAAIPQAVAIEPVPCIVFDGEEGLEQLEHWVSLLHTGPNDGEGLVPWRADEKDRHLARRGGGSLGGQVLVVVRAATGQEYRAESRKGGIISTVTRLVSNPKVRARLGVDLRDGKLISLYPSEEVIKGLIRVVEDLVSGKEDSRSLHNVEAREAYAAGLKKRDLPDKSTRLTTPIPLAAPSGGTASSGATATGVAAGASTGRRTARAPRKTLVPKNCNLKVSEPRIRQLFLELADASVEDQRNLCALGLRVFTELSVDNLLDKHRLMNAENRKNTPLPKRMKVAAEYLEKHKGMDGQLRIAVEQLADSKHSLLAAGVVTWNQYVHNKYVFPKPTELRDAWDELEPFFAHLWP